MKLGNEQRQVRVLSCSKSASRNCADFGRRDPSVLKKAVRFVDCQSVTNERMTYQEYTRIE